MARIRTVKPSMAQDEDLAECSAWAQLLAVRLLNHADDEGYFQANPKLVKSNCFPLVDEDSLNIHGILTELSNMGYLRLFEGSDTKQYGHIRKFTEHQKINRPSPSKIRELDTFTEPSMSAHGGLTLGKEGKGKEYTADDESSAYRFEGETIKLNQRDFDKLVTQYPNLDLDEQLRQLDLELRGKRQWFVEMNSKLNYRNKTPTHHRKDAGEVSYL